MSNNNVIINFFISGGVPLETIKLLLMLPVVATFIAFLRQVVGIKAFGIYTPAIIMFAFFSIGLKYGIAIFVSVIFVGMIVKFLLKKLRLLYLPRVAITISIIALSMLLVLMIGGYFQRTGLAAVSIFPLLIMITIVEKFIATQIEKGARTAMLLTFETFIIALMGYYLLKWEWLVQFVINFPWIVIFTLPFNILLGKWTGLRLSEYIRFRKLIKYIETGK